MKRGTGDEPESDATKKRVRFDPETTKQESDDGGGDVESSVPAATKRRRKRGEDDDLDVLGRTLQASSSEQKPEEPEDDKDKKHTLDSDEEDDVVAPKRLDIKAIHGQEKATIEYDDKIKIMPFNMNEELEEGYYDDAGNFVYEKKTEDVRDQWLDNLDWDAAKHKAGDRWNKLEDAEEEAKSPAKIDGVASCRLILKYLTDEKLTVNDVLKRLNSQKNLTPAEERKRRWEAKKQGVEYKNDASETVKELTGAVDDLISLGHMEAYSMKREDILDLCQDLYVTK